MNRINSKKLLQSKWTAVTPAKKIKHFLVTEISIVITRLNRSAHPSTSTVTGCKSLRIVQLATFLRG
ncbi:MAG: TIGR02450 family Trp-rich protein [Gammaproteobacteria bacterium]|nr:TIGR02450 family Trp-rich protein [Gammaproteobacteria bacterium]MBT3867808.1 TIGR02450 family Trp-rich protein [Gammaproteobacteria bacterium]MBT4380100.1 TIGR02450 family Trp-rich protein [Gammaproteobacteria bacterium]MBT4617912.1 TIGR02450 family Trp-rich protein [Gammaproteobacteria bacterium]MBT5196207.1 TIGR02450 family Trp-rich protein [Gammaproteobacteria bacterium]